MPGTDQSRTGFNWAVAIGGPHQLRGLYPRAAGIGFVLEHEDRKETFSAIEIAGEAAEELRVVSLSVKERCHLHEGTFDGALHLDGALRQAKFVFPPKSQPPPTRDISNYLLFLFVFRCFGSHFSFQVLTEYILVSITSAVTVTIAGVVKEAVTILVRAVQIIALFKEKIKYLGGSYRFCVSIQSSNIGYQL
ncbi:hypothetical protein RHGRI_017413 [Rhododendron griersonianum]|uniref:Uncharacterized protein n=1 Tax=Rhododendron griersonianum TaxID=479676 RepID=A0AAV6JXQ0_9ERIC|nr:hypothetical protein RHGRI_017413 [Rhododendron griersonianum]